MSEALVASKGRTMVASFAALLFAMSIATSAHATGPLVALDTSLGRIVVELDTDRAPQTSYNFLRYVADRHYDGTLFHRVMEGFVVQGGGLTPDMEEKPTHEPIANEAKNGLSNVAGTIAMAREDAVNSATSQFFINVVDNLRLDHVNVPPEGVTLVRRGKEVFYSQADADKVFGYAVFGHVVQGQDVVERMRHVAVKTVEHGKETFENVPIEPVVIRKAVLLPPSN
jgi:peptidyl-prolyl cis-trans isomerase A (cyclophilin A)